MDRQTDGMEKRVEERRIVSQKGQREGTEGRRREGQREGERARYGEIAGVRHRWMDGWMDGGLEVQSG